MKPFYVTFFILSIIFLSCSNSGNEVNNEKQDEVSTPESVIKTSRQFITNEDGTVTENTVNTEIQFFTDKISFLFATDTAKNFEIIVTAKDVSPEGTKYTVKDKKFTDVFVAAGEEPQVNLNAVYGSTTFM